MTNRLDALEGIVEKLAYEFAVNLLDAAVRSRITDLSVVLREAVPVDATSLATAIERAIPRLVRAAQLAPERAISTASRAPSQRQQLPPRRTTSGPRRTLPLGKGRERSFDAPPTDEGDGAGDVITDPTLLLEVIGSGVAPAPRSPRADAKGGSSLLADSKPTPPEPVEQGPALRPGERLQRTAGGNVVLRRGAK